MFEENENLVTEEVTENTENTVEEIVEEKKYTEAEMNAKVDEILGKKIARKEAKIRKQYDREYGELLNVLKAGTGKESIGDLTGAFRDFYAEQGVTVSEPTFSKKDLEILAKAEAEEIIRGGLDEVVEEVDRLNTLGAAAMSEREKAIYKTLSEYRNNAERVEEMSKIGITEDVYESAEFKEFASKFSPKTPIRDIVDIYTKTQPKKDIKPMGSMKQVTNNGVKDYYSPEEISRLSEEDLDNPHVWEAVRRSMTGR